MSGNIAQQTGDATVVPAALFARRISLGGIALILAGMVSFAQAILTANVPTDPALNIDFATGANAFVYRFGNMLIGIWAALFILGMFALYAYLAQSAQERLAFIGMCVTVGLLIVFLPLTGFAIYIVPAIGVLVSQGQPEMVSVMDQTFQEPFIVIAFLAGIFWNAGKIPLGIAIWRSGTLWKWAGLLFVVQGLASIPAFVMDLIGFAAITLAALMTIAQVGAGLSLRRAAIPLSEAGPRDL